MLSISEEATMPAILLHRLGRKGVLPDRFSEGVHDTWGVCLLFPDKSGGEAN